MIERKFYSMASALVIAISFPVIAEQIASTATANSASTMSANSAQIAQKVAANSASAVNSATAGNSVNANSATANSASTMSANSAQIAQKVAANSVQMKAQSAQQISAKVLITPAEKKQFRRAMKEARTLQERQLLKEQFYNQLCQRAKSRGMVLAESATMMIGKGAQVVEPEVEIEIGNEIGNGGEREISEIEPIEPNGRENAPEIIVHPTTPTAPATPIAPSEPAPAIANTHSLGHSARSYVQPHSEPAPAIANTHSLGHSARSYVQPHIVERKMMPVHH